MRRKYSSVCGKKIIINRFLKYFMHKIRMHEWRKGIGIATMSGFVYLIPLFDRILCVL